MSGKSLVLPLIKEEKANLRKAKVKIKEIHSLNEIELQQVLGVTVKRAQELKGLAAFQQIPSIGVKIAEKMVYQLGYYSLESLKNKDGAKLLDQLEQRLGVWTDPCVEDQIRCIIYHANHPGSEKVWSDFTGERKEYRRLAGYPSTRPKQAWYE